MKKIIFAIISLVLLTGCYDREVIDAKEFNYSLPALTEISHTMLNPKIVRFTWVYPEDISEDFQTPVEVQIQVVENGIYKQIVNVDKGAVAKNVTINPDISYKFMFRLLGYLKEEVKETGKTDRVFSPNTTYEIETEE